MKIKYKQIAKSLTGFSTPFFGVSWNPPETDRDIVKRLIIFLEDKMVLFNPRVFGEPFFYAPYAIQSIDDIRARLTKTIQIAGDDSDISHHLRAMRAACRKCKTEIQPEDPAAGHAYMERYGLAIGELRAVFGIHIAQLAVKYGIDIEEELASILPIEDK